MLANKGLTMTSTSSSPTRRSFLAGSAATGAVSFLPMHFVAARDVSASEKSNQEGSPMGRTKADAIYVAVDQLIVANRTTILAAALGERLPTIFSTRDFVNAGGLMSYGPNYSDLFRHSADYVDKILRGI